MIAPIRCYGPTHGKATLRETVIAAVSRYQARHGAPPRYVYVRTDDAATLTGPLGVTVERDARVPKGCCWLSEGKVQS